ncbi:hypothetical protein [Ruminiclostridium cellobioparum]|uniref:Uncharacterized protein n=1 Tax=Ruminiclostridium cellobioparum subsp. termitidis CT1112 TaxID=1195236 RepID=S0FU36_RUMCE|nr:hypothetical protein [Ruminiclostridium cellobioparum]EMS72028.1 hypothetical protein CTER_2061 [Ruminiclostridium cellobioparum subsp. termitidis CT1112]
MKNRKLKLGLLVMAAVTVFTATAFAAGTGNEGYETLKQIMKDSRGKEILTSASVDGTFRISDNGKIITELNGRVKADHESKESSGNVQISLKGRQQDLSFFQNGEEVYLSDETNNKYYKLVNAEHGKYGKNMEYNKEDYDYAGDHGMGTAEEKLIDYLAGDLKSQIALTRNPDGSKTLTMDLDQNEIPMPLNLLTAVAVGNKGIDQDSSDRTELDQVRKQLLAEKLPFLKDYLDIDNNLVPALKENVKLAALVIKVNVDQDNQIKSFEARISITGNDAGGTYHDISLQGSAAVSDINKTSADKFNADGKNVEIINAEDFKCSRE